MRSDEGQALLQRCADLGLQVEYELHAMEHLLPREQFAQYPELFRVNEQGDRSPDANLCPNSDAAMEIVAENAVVLCEVLRPTSGRYFIWGDDGRAWCHCPKCRSLSDSDQALLVDNHLLRALRRSDPRATFAHLAYHETIAPPSEVVPEPGIFLEFAPIHRQYDAPLVEQSSPDMPDSIEALQANLSFFGTQGAQVLEYWLDNSRFSGWKRENVKAVPWRPDVMAADLDAYGGLGVQHITTFACFMGYDYVQQFGEPPVDEYGELLRDWRPG